MKGKRLVLILMVLCLVFALIVGCSQQQTAAPAAPAAPAESSIDKFPEKPITLILPFGAGGSHDAHARLMEAVAKKYTNGQPLIIELKPGGSGAVGSSLASIAEPDGYTLLFGSNGANTVVPIMEELPYGITAFDPVARINYSPQFVITHANSGYKTIQDVIDDVKKNPGKISFASSGMFNAGHIGLELFQRATGTQFNHVPMEGAEPQLAVLAEQVPLGGAFADEFIDLAKEGKIIPLLVTSQSRMHSFPDVPCYKDVGVDASWEMWRTVLAPKGTPPEIIDKLDNIFKQICEDPEFIEMVEKMGEEVFYMGHDEFADFWAEEWGIFEGIFKAN